jgi:hypothetical protein
MGQGIKRLNHSEAYLVNDAGTFRRLKKKDERDQREKKEVEVTFSRHREVNTLSSSGC